MISFDVKKPQKFIDIIDAFWELYRAKNINKISVKEILYKAGCNRSTFYMYFKNKEDVLNTIKSLLIETIDLENSKLTMSSRFIAAYERNSEYWSFLLGPDGDKNFIIQLKDYYKTFLIKNFQDQQKSEDEIEFQIEYMLSPLMNSLSFLHKKNKPIQSDEIISMIKEMTKKNLV